MAQAGLKHLCHSNDAAPLVDSNTAMEDYKAQERRQYQAGQKHNSGEVNQFQRWWAKLSEEQERQVLGVTFLVLVLLLRSRAVPVMASVALAWFHHHLPRESSFDVHFQRWFTQEYFPKVSQNIQKELQDRSRNSWIALNLFGSLAAQLKRWIMGETEGLQAEVLGINMFFFMILILIVIPTEFSLSMLEMLIFIFKVYKMILILRFLRILCTQKFEICRSLI